MLLKEWRAINSFSVSILYGAQGRNRTTDTAIFSHVTQTTADFCGQFLLVELIDNRLLLTVTVHRWSRTADWICAPHVPPMAWVHMERRDADNLYTHSDSIASSANIGTHRDPRCEMQGTCDPRHAARSKNLVVPVP
jgi:hypothetical protein